MEVQAELKVKQLRLKDFYSVHLKNLASESFAYFVNMLNVIQSFVVLLWCKNVDQSTYCMKRDYQLQLKLLLFVSVFHIFNWCYISA